MALSKIELEKQKQDRLYSENYNKQNCLMKIIKYDGVRKVTVQFQDKFKYTTTTFYKHFLNGSIINPYYPDVLGVGICGTKYPTKINGKNTKEYRTWYNMLLRCYDKKIHEREPTYIQCECCEEWLLYENFYEWIHSQENFDTISKIEWALDKDILIKNNKIYSPNTCCLVPQTINNLFIKSDATRGQYPIGVSYYKNISKYASQCHDGNKNIYLGVYNTPEEAFYVYKNFKEKLIKNNAKQEYSNHNITKQCYDAMITYEVEITD